MRTPIMMAAGATMIALAGCTSDGGEGEVDLAAVEQDLVDPSRVEDLLDFEPEFADYMRTAEGTVPITAGELAVGLAVPIEPEACRAIWYAAELSTVDDAGPFADDVRIEHGLMIPEIWEEQDSSPEALETPAFEVVTREFAAAEVPSQVVQAAVDAASGCGAYEWGPNSEGVSITATDVAVAPVALDGVDGDAVRIDYLVTSEYLPDLPEDDVADEPNAVYVYPHGRHLVRVAIWGEADDALAADVLGQWVAHLDG